MTFGAIATEAELESLLARPTDVSREAMRSLEGDLIILGAGGKMGPSLARLARRSADEAGRRDLRVIAVSRFSAAEVRRGLEADGVETIRCDLADESQRRRLPQAPNALFMFGHKFSRDDLPGTYWAANCYLPGLLAEQYAKSRIVCFSSGNVYPFTPLGDPPPTEETPAAPVGEYAWSVLARERMLEHTAAREGTPVCLLRLNYAVEARYGVLVDLGESLLAGRPIDLAVPEMNFIWQGHANAISLASFSLAKSPAAILNVTGATRHRVRDLAERLASRLGVTPQFSGEEGLAALVSDATGCQEKFGPGALSDDDLLDLVAAWLKRGGPTLGKPTGFHVRDGKY